MRKINPYIENEGISYLVECDNCNAIDQGATVDELEIAMMRHICNQFDVVALPYNVNNKEKEHNA